MINAVDQGEERPRKSTIISDGSVSGPSAFSAFQTNGNNTIEKGNYKSVKKVAFKNSNESKIGQ